MTEEGQDYRAWLVYDGESARLNRPYIQMHHEIGAGYGIHFRLLSPEQVRQRLHGPDQEDPKLPDFAIVRTICPELSEELEGFSVPVFNPAAVSRICNDKGKTIDFIKKNSEVPVIETTRYANRELSGTLMRRYPGHVIKSVDGHGGREVFFTSDPFPQIVRGIGTSDFIIQPFVRGKGRDVRVYVIGTEIIAAVERTSVDGFRSNFSLGGRVRLYPLGQEERHLVETVCRLFDFGMVGIDFIIDETGSFILNEIEDVVGARMLYQCQPGIRLLEKYFTFILDKLLHCN